MQSDDMRLPYQHKRQKPIFFSKFTWSVLGSGRMTKGMQPVRHVIIVHWRFGYQATWTLSKADTSIKQTVAWSWRWLYSIPAYIFRNQDRCRWSLGHQWVDGCLTEILCYPRLNTIFSIPYSDQTWYSPCFIFMLVFTGVACVYSLCHLLRFNRSYSIIILTVVQSFSGGRGEGKEMVYGWDCAAWSQPFHSQKWSMSTFPCSLIKTSHYTAWRNWPFIAYSDGRW